MTTPMAMPMRTDSMPPIGRPPIPVRQRSGDSDKSSDGRVHTIESSPVQAHQLNPDVSVPQNSSEVLIPTHPTQSFMNANEPQSTQAVHVIPVVHHIMSSQISHATHQSQQRQYTEAEFMAAFPNRSEHSGEVLQDINEQRPKSTVVLATADGVSPQSEGDSDDEDDVDVADELRKLDEDFQKNLERAKKVFVNRMDNLQRSQIEREAQHLKTLEKHEKERAEFEKRLAQETEQQQRRIEQLQREWDKKRETIAIQKKKQKEAPMLPNSDPNSELTLGHLRTISATSSNFSLSPAMSVHKHQESNGDTTQMSER